MQSISSFFRAETVAGLGVAALHLIVASALVTLSLTLCVAIALLAGLRALASQPQRAINALRSQVTRADVRKMRPHSTALPERRFEMCATASHSGMNFLEHPNVKE
jgi:hypothetical protein